MKARTLIIIGIVSAVAIAVTIGVFVRLHELDQVESPVFDYKQTKQLTSETYLSKNVQQWQEMSMSQLNPYYEKYGDEFYINLGQLLMKNEMIHQLDIENIVNANDDFDVYSGSMLTSLPPHVSFEAIVNGTDGNTYRLQGGTFANKVSYYKTSQLVFYDTAEKLPLESVLSQNNTIIIEEQDNNPVAIPHDLIISGNGNTTVNFQNNLMVPIRIQSSDGDWKTPDWYGPTILPLSTGSMSFDKPGVFEWHARTLPAPGSTATDHMGGGQINVIPDDTDMLSFQEKQQIGAAILRHSDIPWTGMGSGNSKGITLDFNRAILELPDAKKYYKARAEQFIPFDIPIIIEDPYRTE